AVAGLLVELGRLGRVAGQASAAGLLEHPEARAARQVGAVARVLAARGDLFLVARVGRGEDPVALDGGVPERSHHDEAEAADDEQREEPGRAAGGAPGRRGGHRALHPVRAEVDAGTTGAHGSRPHGTGIRSAGRWTAGIRGAGATGIRPGPTGVRGAGTAR